MSIRNSRRNGGRAPLSFSRWLLLLPLLWLAALPSVEATAGELANVPAELQGWQNWELQGDEAARCPLIVGTMAGATQAAQCSWPHALDLRVDARGGRFSQVWEVFARTWVALPGDAQHWPRDVSIAGKSAAVVLRDGRPQLLLAAGSYAVTGRFEWTSRPEQLALPPEIGIVQLTVDGQRVAQPDRPGDAVAFGRPARAAQSATLDMQVYRLVSDEIPAMLTTRLRLQVAGEPREQTLGRALPDGFQPVSLSGPLPARLDADGNLRVQVRSGSYELQLVARGASVAGTLKRPPRAAPWPVEEVWSFQGIDRLRVASAEGAEGIDPAQANVPADWRAFPAFRLAADGALNIVERSRGLANADENRLSLDRQIWLDFNHSGFTAVDVITGRMRQQWRLDAIAPLRLQAVRSGAESLLVTQGADPQHAGVELRDARVNVNALARLSGVRASLPATGWDTRFESVRGTLHLPVGHRLLGTIGPDSTQASWWSRWGLWSLFGVIMVVAFTLRVSGWPVAAVALAALLLTHQEEPSFIWLWANALLAIGLTSVVPAGRLQSTLRGYRLSSLGVLGIALLPMLWGQVRLALYPQLEAQSYGAFGGVGDLAAVTGVVAPQARAVEQASVESDEPEANGGASDKLAAPAAAMKSLPESDAQERRSAPPASIASKYAQPLQRYALGTQIQTGPGVPKWNYVSYRYGWSGPVDPDATVRFIFIGPVLLALWRVVGVVLLALWFFALLQQAFSFTPPALLRGLTNRLRSARERDAAVAPRGAASLVAVLLALGAALTGVVAGPTAQAASTPDPALLTELRNRLLAPPACEPNCADISRAVVRAQGDRLDVQLDVSALAFVSLAVPSADAHWQIDTLTVDGAGSLAVRRAGDGNLWVPLRPGVRVLRMSGRIVAANDLQLVFPQRPRTVDVTTQGWDIAGVNESRLISGAIELTRHQAKPGSQAAASEQNDNGGAQFPAFVRVLRNFNLDLDWTLNTMVQRVAPERAAVTVDVPLVSGESVLSEDIKLRDGKLAIVGLAAGENQISWNSALARADQLTLAVPLTAPRSEVWNFVVNPQWRVSFSGVPATLPDQADAGPWVFSFFPRAGETLQLGILRPVAVPGPTLAIDGVSHQRRVGARSSDEALEFAYRSTQGGRHSITLPAAARVTSVMIDDAAVPLRPERGELSIGLLPGQHRVQVQWQSPTGATLGSSLDAVDLHSPASNIHTELTLPADRWPLFALGRGAGVGPAVLYWGELVALFALAWALGRWSWSPLRTHEWLLLGLGLSTQSWSVFVTVALWLFALRWRLGWPGTSRRWVFNLVQLSLALFTVVALSTLLFTGIQYGFLSSPEMGVVGEGSGGNVFAWFRDQTASSLPQPLVLSVPMWTYKTLILLWALWTGWAVTRWLRFAWQAWSAAGFWRGRVVVAGSAAGTDAPS